MEHQIISVLGVQISEPGTTFTDLMLAILCFAIFIKVNTNFFRTHFIDAWKFFFFFMGLSTFIGFIIHGFPTYLNPSVFNYGWMTMNISAAIASYFTLKAMIKFVTRNVRERKRINQFNFYTLSLFILFTLFLNNFEIVKIYIALAVTGNFIAHLIGHFKEDSSSRYIMLGMLISFLTLIVHYSQITFNIWVDYKSISHIIMMTSSLLIYQGLKKSNSSFEAE